MWVNACRLYHGFLRTWRLWLTFQVVMVLLSCCQGVVETLSCSQEVMEIPLICLEVGMHLTVLVDQVVVVVESCLAITVLQSTFHSWVLSEG